MFYKYIKILYASIFSIPIIISFYVNDFVFDNYLLAFIIFCLIIFSQKNKDIFFDINSVRPIKLIFLILVSFLILYFLFDFFAFNGLRNRELVREGSVNFNANSVSFFQQQLNFILIALSATCVSKGIFNNKSLLFTVGFIIALYTLFFYGTRWVFLLSISPLICYFLISSGKLLKLLFVGLFSLLLFSLSVLRSSSEISLLSALTYDIPSFQSKVVLNNYDSNLFDILDFFNGNILILIPRFIWPDKPIDEVTTNYMLDLIGNRFYEGSTILPGFIGSAYLYGNFLGVIVFSFFLRYLISKLLIWNKKLSASENLVTFSLSFFGIILQSRGISIFYFIPLIYCVIFFKIRRILLSQNTR